MTTLQQKIAIGFFGIALIVSLFLIAQTIGLNLKAMVPKECCEGWQYVIADGPDYCVALPTAERLPDSWTTALAARLHNAIEQWHTCPKDSLLAVEECRYEVTSQADAILGDLGGHAPYTDFPWDLIPQEGTECWQRLNQLGAVAEYMARLGPQDYDFAQLHYNIAMRYSCVGVLP